MANLRAAHGRAGAHARAAQLLAVLRRRSEEFANFWERHEVGRRFTDHKVLLHPELGELEVDCQILFTEDQSQVLLVITAAPGSDTDEKLELLVVIGTQDMEAGR